MRAADFLNIPHLYWAMMREVHLRCDDLSRGHWDALFPFMPSAFDAPNTDDGDE